MKHNVYICAFTYNNYNQIKKMKTLKNYEKKKKESKPIKEIKFSGVGKAKDFKTPLGTIKDLIEVINPNYV